MNCLVLLSLVLVATLTTANETGTFQEKLYSKDPVSDAFLATPAPFQAPRASQTSGAVVIQSSTSQDVYAAADMWNKYLPSAPARTYIQATLVDYGSTGLLGVASCKEINNTRMCNITAHARSNFKALIFVHEIGHALLPWDSHRIVAGNRYIDGGGHWKPPETNEIMAPYISSVSFMAPYTVSAAASKAAGGSGNYNMCSDDCYCVQSNTFMQAPMVCSEQQRITSAPSVHSSPSVIFIFAVLISGSMLCALVASTFFVANPPVQYVVLKDDQPSLNL